jgi:hypothetical protein
VALKLRQAAIDPRTLTITGAQTATISVPGGPSTDHDSKSGTANGSSQTAQQAPVVIRQGDTVNVTIIDGPVVVTTQATAVGSGAIGDRIRLERMGSAHDLTGTIIDSQNVEIKD